MDWNSESMRALSIPGDLFPQAQIVQRNPDFQTDSHASIPVSREELICVTRYCFQLVCSQLRLPVRRSCLVNPASQRERKKSPPPPPPLLLHRKKAFRTISPGSGCNMMTARLRDSPA